MSDAPAPAATLTMPLPPLSFHVRRAAEQVVGRSVELAAVQQELAVAKSGQLAALTLEGEPGIGKTRLLVAAAELAAAQGFTHLAVAADEEIRGPFLLARAILASAATQHAGTQDEARQTVERALQAISGDDEPGLEGLLPDHKVLRVFDLAAVAIRTLSAHNPVALLIDDLQWADKDSLRLLRYVIRTAADIPLFLALTVRPEEISVVTEGVTLIADMERMGMVRRLKLARFTQLETAEFLKQVLGGRVDVSSAAAMHAQAEGVPFIVEELARTYRDAGMIQEIDGVWTLARNAERLVPQAVRTLIQRRSARLPEETRITLAEAAILGRSFSLKDLRAIKLHLAEDEQACDPEQLAQALVPACRAGLLIELPEASPADYRFAHDQVKEFAAAALTPARRRAIHAAIVDVLAGGEEPAPASLPLLARHALAAGDAERAARFSVDAARAALVARAPEEVLRVVELALPSASAPADRVALLTARDDALDMLRRSGDRLEGLAEMGALAEAMGDLHLELEAMLRRAAALRLSGDEERAAQLAREVRDLAAERGDRRAELAASLELGQNLLRSPLGESFSPAASEVDLDGASEAYTKATALAEELGDLATLAAATRELGVIGAGRGRAWFIERVQRGEHIEMLQRIAAGETPEAVLADSPVAPVIRQAREHYQRALELFQQMGDRRGVMSSIIGMAYITFGIDIHFRGSAKRIEEIRRLTGRLRSFTRQSEQSLSDGQMLYGGHVFARAKVIPDVALSRGEEAYQQARAMGERPLEFAAAGGVALVHLELGEVEQAERWLDRAAAAAAEAPTPLRARQLELWRGMARGAASDVSGMRQHLERALRLATDQGRPAARCEVLARVAAEAARVASEADEDLLALAERSAREAKDLMKVLPGRPPWGVQADAALAEVALARGAREEAADAARSALSALEALQREDLHLDIFLPVARVICATGSDDERQAIRDLVRMMLAMVAQRTVDEDVRVRWFRGPLGHELSKVGEELEHAPGYEDEAREVRAAGDGRATRGRAEAAGIELSDDDTRLLWLVIEGRTNGEIAQELGVTEEMVVRRLGEIYAKLGTSTRAEATAFAFTQGVI